MSGENNDITVFIIAASPIVRAGLEAVLRAEERLFVAGAAAEMPYAPPDFPNRQPIDVFLINIEREKDFDNLLELLGDASATEADDFPKIVALFPFEMQTTENIVRAVRSDVVRAVLPHNATANEITAAVLSAANNLISLTPETAESLLSFSEIADTPNSLMRNGKEDFPVETIENLTAREHEVLEMLAEGASNKTIAFQLNISEHTVKFHVASVFGKLGVNSRTEAVTQALRRGLVLL